ncbi:MAG: hypothetical protein FWH53_00150 [Leptospirales bacterium]|nr:hypothetical protein [Leptospirales bacterium]
MDEKLKARLEEIRKTGLEIDVKRNVALTRCLQTISLSGEADKTADKLTLDEDEKYIYAPFRALSAVLIADRAIDFSKTDVLKKSSRMLQGQTVYPNHDHDVNKWLGTVVKSWWEDATPPGVNVTLKINKEWNQRVVAGIKDGAIHSASVDVIFEFEKSHPDLEDFYYHLGETINGKIVALTVTKILSYGEISLVWQGADGFAKRLDLTLEGAGAADQAKKTEGGLKGMKITRSLLIRAGLAPSSYGMNASAQEVELDEKMSEKLMSELDVAINTLSDSLDKQTELLNEIFGEGEKNSDLAKKITENAKIGETYLSDVRSDAIKFAKLAEGVEKLSDALERAIMNASIEDAKKFRDDYQAKVEEKMPVRCAKCGGTMTRGSASKSEQGADEEIDLSSYQLPGGLKNG